MTTEREKGIWFVPKRANVHQMIALLDGIIARKYDGKIWNATKQDNLNLELKRLGATQKGTKIAPQGMRTLLASVHFLGFVYLDTSSRPSVLRITKAGYDFYNYHKSNLKPLEKLDNDLTINTSPYVKDQLVKLQITNPIILKYCEDVYVFPYRVTLELIQYLDYLTIEEIAMFVFFIRDSSEIAMKVKEIKNFRNLSRVESEDLVNTFKDTKIGNKTLKQAPSAGYFMQFCTGSGILEKRKIKMKDTSKKVSALFIKKEKIEWVKETLYQYKNIVPYNFDNDLNLWIEYFGDIERKTPPFDTNIINKENFDVFYELFDRSKTLKDSDIISFGDTKKITLFENENYTLTFYHADEYKEIRKLNFQAVKEKNINFKINNDISSYGEVIKKNTFKDLKSEILEHSESRTFSETMLVRLKILENRTGLNKIDDKSLRGAYLEFLFNKILKTLKENDIIEEVIWNGSIGKYNLPTQSPGGKLGNPDIIFIKDNVHYVLELTTIKSKSTQEKAELSSVSDHIRLYKNKVNNKQITVKGIFCAPIVHERTHNTMKSILQESNTEIVSLTIIQLLNILEESTKYNLNSLLNEVFNKGFFISD
ncbi:AlwI family type II restriction endonuclease [Staphylococcus epidermidis]|uniref:AlwI family type II restriction endonuclease n=1 Tax=Staphylococcus epidermidis TaxID=1282 RepID=UPI0021A26A12|nr:AlwI family type II restriction endonuclease [Staphylococcus epidermidis]MCT1763990.1 AlwI family type II restriction endonuclease [Staphylococcus epidermidis]MCT1832153.1 AlwI family type II restriction endonuclease [Staphylococcus epidermidis]